MDKRTFIIAMAIEIPVAFVVLTLLLNNMSDWVFYTAWALFAVGVFSIFAFLKKEKDEEKKEKLRKKIARTIFISILGGAVIIVCVVLTFVVFYSIEAGF